ncbi:murein biosynthesis integral membrane protein MurJ [Austwickia chelonae]|uniref:murein biosynthesis integral membrane protein MurJ n=1 Tax=Austwickia chelonae TaxID=100225 RepID=UPI000E26EDA2|nr:murein biosynthesis integral membrane protein MurJ [Austwickia chelonae]
MSTGTSAEGPARTRDDGAPSTRGDGVARGSVLMASGSLVSRGLGVVRTSLIAGLFGTHTASGDAWQVANTLPTTVYMLLAAGVINAVFVPQLAKAAEQPDGGKDFVDRLITLSLLCLGGVTLLAIPLAPWLVTAFASHWPESTFNLSVQFAYVVLPAIFFYGLYAVLGQILSAKNHFGAYGWAPAACNIVWLAGLAAFMLMYPGKGAKVEEWTGPMILIVGGSLTAGVALQALVLLIPLWRIGWRYRPRFGFRGVGLRSASHVAGWTFAGIAITQAAMAVTSNVLTSSNGKGVSRLGYDSVFFLFMTPHGLISVSLATALFTAMSTAAAHGNLIGVRAQLRRGLRLIGVATIPTTIAGLCVATAGTAIVFPANDLADTRAMADVFLLLILALLPYGVMFLVQRVFYAFEDAKTPFYLSALAAAIFAGVSWGASWVLQPQHLALGVAAAATLSDIVAAIVGMRWAADRLGGMQLLDVWETWTRSLFASLGAGLLTLFVIGVCQVFVPGRLGALVILICGGAFYGVTYLGAGRWLRIRELDDLLGPVLKRLPGGMGRSGRHRP